MTCNHTDGWNLVDTLTINPDYNSNQNWALLFACNHLGCNERKAFTFDITNIQEYPL